MVHDTGWGPSASEMRWQGVMGSSLRVHTWRGRGVREEGRLSGRRYAALQSEGPSLPNGARELGTLELGDKGGSSDLSASRHQMPAGSGKYLSPG